MGSGEAWLRGGVMDGAGASRLGLPPRTPYGSALRPFAAGYNFKFVITRGERIHVMGAGASFAGGAPEGVEADVLFLCTDLLGMQGLHFQRRYIEQTLGATGPGVFVPLHWDDILKPWGRGEARFIDVKPALGFGLVIDGARTIGAKCIVRQDGSRLRIPDERRLPR